MNTVRTAAVLALIAAASPALAQPGAEELPPPAPVAAPQPPPPSGGTVVVVQPEPGQGYASQQPPVRAVVAPMNEDWNNVSHINGHPVKVGERGDYLHTYKKMNISSNPIGWMFGFYGLSVSHAVGKHAALRADANLFDVDDESGYEVGLTLPLYFKQVYKGPFIEGGIMVRQLGDECYDCMERTANVGPQVLFGWHWSFDSGANVALAFGAFRPMNNGKTQDDVEPAGYFRIGYAY